MDQQSSKPMPTTGEERAFTESSERRMAEIEARNPERVAANVKRETGNVKREA